MNGGAANPGHRYAAEVDALAKRLAAWQAWLSRPLSPLVVYGSSTVRLWPDAAADMGRDDVVPVGFGGARLGDLAAHFDRLVAPLRPETLVIACGANDLDLPGTTPAAIAGRVARLLDCAQSLEAMPDTYVLTLKPSPVLDARLDAILAANHALAKLLAQRRAATLIDTCTPFLLPEGRADPRYYIEDRRHMNAAGYARWASLLTAALPPAPAPSQRGGMPMALVPDQR